MEERDYSQNEIHSTAGECIIPKKTKITNLSGLSKGFKVTWSKITKQTTGYEINYSTSKKFTNAKKVDVAKNTTTSKKVTKLKAKKNYYVRIRTYTKVGTTKYYSEWSEAKKVKTK